MTLQVPSGSHIRDFGTQRARLGTFKKMSKIFFLPEGLCGAEPEGGPIVFTLDFIGLGKGTGGFKIRIFHRPF